MEPNLSNIKYYLFAFVIGLFLFLVGMLLVTKASGRGLDESPAKIELLRDVFEINKPLRKEECSVYDLL